MCTCQVCDLLTLHLLSMSQISTSKPMSNSAAVSVKPTVIPKLLMSASVLLSTMCENDATAFKLSACYSCCCNAKHSCLCEVAWLVCFFVPSNSVLQANTLSYTMIWPVAWRRQLLLISALLCNSKDNLVQDCKNIAGQREHANDVVAVVAVLM